MLQRERQNRLVRIVAGGQAFAAGPLLASGSPWTAADAASASDASVRTDPQSSDARARYEHHGLTRQELANAMELNLTTVTRLAGGLIEQGLLASRSRLGVTGRGRPSEALTLQPDARYALGLEFGRDQLLGVLVDALGDAVFQKRFEAVPPFDNTLAVTTSLGDAIESLVTEAGIAWDAVAAIGVALHDVVDAAGRWSVHRSARAGSYPIAAQLMHRFARTIVAEDVSRAFAFAEQRRGAGVGRPDITYVFVGRHGVGGGIFVNGLPLRSSTGVCGEVGHIVVVPQGKQCHCGSRGCLETVATPGAVLERYLELVSHGVPASLDGSELTFPSLCAAAQEGDKAAYLVLDELANALAIALAAAVNVGGGSSVIIGGPLRLAGEGFRGRLEAELKRRVVSPLLNHVSVTFATLSEAAGAWGVALRSLEQAIARGSYIDVALETAVHPLTPTHPGGRGNANAGMATVAADATEAT